MKRGLYITSLVFFLFSLPSETFAQTKKLRIFIVDSYHPQYLWSKDTTKGLCAALKDFKFLDNDQQIDELTTKDLLETDIIVIKKVWMDSKHKSRKDEIKAITKNIVNEINKFKPDLVFLGDDNATNFIGAHLFNTKIPVVFWGVDFNPFAYGYIDSLAHPGHNVTGVYQAEYIKDTMRYLIRLKPSVKKFAILSDASETGLAKTRAVLKLSEDGQLPLQLIDQVATNSFSEWQDRILELRSKVDAFYVVNHGTLRDDNGAYVDTFMAGAWYLSNVKIPEISPEKQFVQEGMLLSVDDSGYKQAYEAGRMADMVLHHHIAPGNIPVVAPSRGAIMVNRQRASMLGIDLSHQDFIEQYIERSDALAQYPP